MCHSLHEQAHTEPSCEERDQPVSLGPVNIVSACWNEAPHLEWRELRRSLQRGSFTAIASSVAYISSTGHEEITPLRRGHHVSGAQSHRKDWRVEPGIGKPSCSADQAHGTQSLNATSGHSHAGLAGLRQAAGARQQALQYPGISYGELPDLWPETTSKTGHYVHAFTKVHDVHDHIFRTVTQTILDAAMSSAACVYGWQRPFVVYDFHRARLRPLLQSGQDLVHSEP